MNYNLFVTYSIKGAWELKTVRVSEETYNSVYACWANGWL